MGMRTIYEPYPETPHERALAELRDGRGVIS